MNINKKIKSMKHLTMPLIPCEQPSNTSVYLPLSVGFTDICPSQKVETITDFENQCFFVNE